MVVEIAAAATVAEVAIYIVTATAVEATAAAKALVGESAATA